MKYIVSMICVAVSLLCGLLLAGSKYRAIGCQCKVRFSKRFIKRFRMAAGAIVGLSMIATYGRLFFDFGGRIIGLSEQVSIYAAIIILAFLLIIYEKTLAYFIEVGEKNSRRRVRAMAQRRIKRCQNFCEQADVGSTTIECCSGMRKKGCPLSSKYEIRLEVDETKAICALEDGGCIDGAQLLNTLFKRVVVKNQDPDSGSESEPEVCGHNLSAKVMSFAVATGNENGSEPEPETSGCNVSAKVTPFAVAVGNEGSFLPRKSAKTPVFTTEDGVGRKRSLKNLKDISFQLRTVGIRVGERDEYIDIKLNWKNSNGEPCSGEWTIDKNSYQLEMVEL